MERVIEKEKCCGCHACINICPKSAITMKEDEKGFLYPVINQDKCINCGMCKKACPVLNREGEIKKEIKTYACYNKNIEERLNSSSGGIFILIAKEIIKRKGVVFGAQFNENFIVRHSYVENEKDLKKFMGSKYTQSIVGDSYKKVKEFLDKDKYVLFTGTPCQIEGLKTFLKKDYNKLYTQDIICHGVPSPKLWMKYLNYQKNMSGEDIKDISFRNKDHSWSLYRMKISFDTRTYVGERKNDLYMQAFLRNICLRDSCYNCYFKKKYRISDITLADYWGINNFHPEMNDDHGTSFVMINSDKGNNLFDAIKENIEYIETDFDNAIKSNSALTKSAEHCINEKEFVANIDKMDINKLVNKYVPYYPTAPFYRKVINKIKIKITKNKSRNNK